MIVIWRLRFAGRDSTLLRLSLLGAANKKRAISMTSTRTPANYVKLVGNVSAGTGILAVENVEGEFPLPKDIFGGDQLL